MGLLAAFSYELSILHTASRLTSADAFRTLHALYRERTHPVAMSSGGLASSSTLEGEPLECPVCSPDVVVPLLVKAIWTVLKLPVLRYFAQCASCGGHSQLVSHI